MIVCFFTKPTKQDFIAHIQPTISRTGIPPVIDYQDQFLFVKINAIYVNAQNPIVKDGREVASAGKEQYIGIFNRFWKIGN